jgi:hypothetical protein
MGETDLNDFVARLLLRYFRPGREADIEQPQIDYAHDLELLRLHWAFSLPLVDLCEYVLTHRHETQAIPRRRCVRTRSNRRKRGGVSLETVLARMRSGHPTLVVFHEPIRSYLSGPNYVLIWTIQHAYLLLRRFAVLAPEESAYGRRARRATAAITQTRKAEPLARAVTETSCVGRPSMQAFIQASQSRSPLYRKAADAFRFLCEIEAGDDDAIRALVRTTLIGPLHQWQTFELATAFAVAGALGKHLGVAIKIRNITAGSATALLEVGPYNVHWQSRTGAYVEPAMEASEARVEEILIAYGVTVGEDRPDIVISERTSGAVLALAEVKHFGDDGDWRGALRDAVRQVVRYGRAYPTADLAALVSRSLIALWAYPEGERGAPAAIAPIVVDFADLRNGQLQAWLARLPV